MLALCVRQPYAELIARGVKTIELRSWQYIVGEHHAPNVTEPFDLLIVASSQLARGARDAFVRYKLSRDECPLSTARCVVRVDCYSEPKEAAYLEAACSPASGGSYGWHLRNPRRVRPFFVRGKLNLFEVDDGLIRLETNSRTAKRSR